MPGDGKDQMALLAALNRNECRTVDFLATLTGLRHRRVVNAAGRLIVRNLAERAERGCFTLTEEGENFVASGKAIKSGPHDPLTGSYRRPKRRTMRDKLWCALRIKGKATLRELLELAANPGREDAGYSNAHRYIAALRAIGYVRLMPRREAGTAPTSNGFQRYQLLKDTGPQAPQWRPRTRSIYDPNTRETHAVGGEPCPIG